MRGWVSLKPLLVILLGGISLGFLAQGVAARSLGNGKYVPHELLVKFKPGTPPYVRQEIHRGVGATVLQRFAKDERLVRVHVPEGLDLDSALAYYSTLADVQYVQKNLLYHIVETIPTDPGFPQQWGWKNTLPNTNPFADVGATFAWDKARGRFSIVVADIDTGVDYTHPDLALNIWTNPGEAGVKCANGIDDDRDGFVDDCRGWNFYAYSNDPMDDNGHGTHTSGTIGALTDNALGVAGANWDVQIMPLKFMDATGTGSTAGAIEALDYAVAHGATISNNSWGTTGFDPGLLDAIKRAEAAGHLFITAAGNSNTNNDISPFYPCDFTKSDPIYNPNPPTNIICVAATDQYGNRAGFSNYGSTTVHLGAPGVDILSTYRNQGYAILSGTSQATPHVTGGAALLKGCNPNLSSVTIKDILLRTVRQSLALIGKTTTGGIVNYQTALDDPLVGACEAAPVSSTMPVANAGGPYNVNIKKPVQFNGTGSYVSGGQILLYFWNFGDGSYGVGPKPVHPYATRGTFTATLTVRDNFGSVSSQSTTVNIRPGGRN
ncbi:MAG: S8 family serine peptidase [Terriglobia bacterium]